MKKVILSFLTIIVCFHAFSQYDRRPSRSRFYNSKFSTFTINAGDILVYEVSKNDSIYNYVATVKKFGESIEFDYNIPQGNTGGTVTIEAKAVKGAVKYDTLNSSKTDLDNESILWLSQANYGELADEKETSMNVGDSTESFARKATGTLRINYKGKEKIITAYNIQSATGSASMAVLCTAANPLILQMDAGYKLTLKEVR